MKTSPARIGKSLRRRSGLRRESGPPRRLYKRRLSIEPLEARTLLTATLYVDFGDRFNVLNGLTDNGNPVTQAQLIAQVRGPQLQDDEDPRQDVEAATQLTFTSFAKEADVAGLTAAQIAAMRDNIMTLLYRYYEPFDVHIVELGGTPRGPRGAAALADIAATLGRDRTRDAYVLVAGITVDTGTLSSTSHGVSGGDDMLNGTNSTDDTVVVLANNLFADGSADVTRGDTAFAYTIAHESGHTFGLQHTSNADDNGDPDDDTRLTTSDIISQYYDSAGRLDPASDQLANFNMFTRFPLQKGDGAGAGDTYVPYDRLVRTVGADRHGPAYVTGTGAHDRITITSNGRGRATVSVEAFRNPDFTDQIGNTYTYALRDTTHGIVVDAGWGDDLVVIDSRLGEHLDVFGMGGDDRIEVQGFTKEGTGTYNPWGMSEMGLDDIESFGGNLSVSSGGSSRTTITFRELEPTRYIWAHGFQSFTLTTPNATDRLDAASPEAGLTEVSGTSSNVQIVPLRVSSVRTLVLDTAARDGAGGSPDDEIRFAAEVAQDAQIKSGPGNDTIFTGSGNDVIDAGAGDDLVNAGPGNDRVFGGRGNDSLIGGEGDDRLDGFDGDDVLDGGPGNDVLRGGAGNDSLLGGDGNDILVGDSGRDTLVAGAGRDLLIGGRDADSLFGDSDDDILIGGTTRYDTNNDALLTILAEWTSDRSIDERIANLTRGVGRNNSLRLKRNATVFTDRAQNELWGGSDADWFLMFDNDRARDWTPGIDRTGG